MLTVEQREELLMACVDQLVNSDNDSDFILSIAKLVLGEDWIKEILGRRSNA